MTLHDAHCHFFSPGFFETLGAERYGARTAADVAAELGWESDRDAEALADRWGRELDAHGVSRAALIASVPGDEASVAAAVRRHPSRFVGFFVLNPAAPGALDRARHAFGTLGLRGVCLFAALHRYALDDERVAAVFSLAAEHQAVVFAHCGYLSIGARGRLGLRSAMDLRLGDPLALAATAAQFPQVPVIIPHFGAGLLREALMAADAVPTIHLDTSSSNAWVKYVPGLTLSDAFRQALAVAGAHRLLFGTDSSFFPRGWRRQILDDQRATLEGLGLDTEAQAKVFGGNFDRLFP